MVYDDMLDRAVEESPDAEGTDSRFDVPEPVVRVDGSVTVVDNLGEIADTLDRDPGHVLQFLQSAVGTAGSVDDRGRGRLTGEFKRGRISTALREYADTYVVCPDCGLPDTDLLTEGDATRLKCAACGAVTTVEER
ncbi:translation initiation factor IF-2 subunit beta [Halorarum halobium]|uniref:translation initiation factor IF-2 subunit beta n=1 Tax=Halorarum halobium TaxID=3075121 RepID=UPI0028AE6C6A|nr:translation initiation factor IF-2 subunit beta [Halobaculum sp. XH14]